MTSGFDNDREHTHTQFIAFSPVKLFQGRTRGRIAPTCSSEGFGLQGSSREMKNEKAPQRALKPIVQQMP